LKPKETNFAAVTKKVVQIILNAGDWNFSTSNWWNNHQYIVFLYLIVPEGSEYEVHLNEDAAEGEKSTHQ
jgi:hypothetical protein